MWESVLTEVRVDISSTNSHWRQALRNVRTGTWFSQVHSWVCTIKFTWWRSQMQRLGKCCLLMPNSDNMNKWIQPGETFVLRMWKSLQRHVNFRDIKCLILAWDHCLSQCGSDLPSDRGTWWRVGFGMSWLRSDFCIRG